MKSLSKEALNKRLMHFQRRLSEKQKEIERNGGDIKQTYHGGRTVGLLEGKISMLEDIIAEIEDEESKEPDIVARHILIHRPNKVPTSVRCSLSEDLSEKLSIAREVHGNAILTVVHVRFDGSIMLTSAVEEELNKPAKKSPSAKEQSPINLNDETIAELFKGTDFGASGKTAVGRRGLLVECVLSYASGFVAGATITRICEEAGLFVNREPTLEAKRWAFREIYVSGETIKERLSPR